MERLKRLSSIGIALSSESNLEKLLEMIVDEARNFTNADAGSLYLRQDDQLHFAIVHNSTLGVRMGGASGHEISWPAIPLYVDGKPNTANVCAFAAINRRIVNIPDVYNAPGFNFEGTRIFDARSGYRSQSYLTVPLCDHENQVIGVLQLINAKDNADVIPFDIELEPLVASLASQAAVALTNAKLIRDTKALFESFVKVMATAIDERSPSTAGHIKRVTDITLALALAVNEINEGKYANTYFDEDQINEMRIAAWMHDVGKITTPIHIIEKRMKLEAIFDRIEMVRLRIELCKQQKINDYLRMCLHICKPGDDDVQTSIAQSEKDLKVELARLDDDMAFLVEMNKSCEFVPPPKIDKLHEIASRTYCLQGEPQPLLTSDELENLSVTRGNVTGEQLAIMREHADVTIKLLQQIPFTRKLSAVCEIAGGHHEKLNGKGYPLHLKAEQIPIQTRMITIADIYEALTARDRSYKKERTPQEALRILGFMAADGEIDAELLRIFQEKVVPNIICL